MEQGGETYWCIVVFFVTIKYVIVIFVTKKYIITVSVTKSA